ncbi:MAG: hypothetical protein CL677_08115 [Bdellovibrionaceae bacterium]|nr:hypothetical protein [Pseudobdellovibrionaceae bacterium]|tara:strand:+ start:80225 stop:80740 length:516 start_codon:yes stop_codon:yes gene_type:complete
MDKDLPPQQLLQVAESVGRFIEYWGFKKIHGQIWTLIFLADRPVDANYLKHSLSVSKALVSMSLKDLIHYNVVYETEKTGATQTYMANTNIYSIIIDVLMQRESKLLGEVKILINDLLQIPKTHREDYATSDRINELQKMTKTADMALKAFFKVRNLDLKSLKSALQLKRA